MKHPVSCSVALICLAAASLGAQQGRISSPETGIVFDSGARALRPILGIPGAATIGAPTAFAQDLAAAWVGPQLDAAIAVSKDGALRVYRLESGTGTERTLDGAAGVPHSVVFSPSGTSALLSSRNGEFVITGLPDAPKVAGKIDLGAIPRSRPNAGLYRISLAITDDGVYVLAGIAGELRVLTVGGENRKLADVGTDAVVAFATASHDAAVADSTGGVVVYRDLARAAAPKTVTRADSSLPQATGLAFSSDRRRLFLASGAARSVTTFEIDSGSRTSASCSCAPTGLVRMGNVFRLNDLDSGPLWLLDVGAAEPRIVFVPALVAGR